MLDKKIINLLKPLKTKYFLKKFIHIITLALMLWGGISLVIMIVSRFIPITFIWNKLLLILAFSLVFGGIGAFYKKPSFRDTATLIDSFELKERVSTSLELMGKETVVAKLQKEDTIKLLEDKALNKQISIKPSMKILSVICIILLATVSISFIPTKSYVLAKEKEDNFEKVEEEKAKIEKIKNDIGKDEELTLEEKKMVQESLEKVNKELENLKSVKEAQKELVKSKKELNRIKEDLNQRKADEIAENMKHKSFTKKLAQKLMERDSKEIAKEIEEMTKKIESLNKEELEKLVKNLKELQEAFKNNPEMANAFKEIRDAVAQSIKEGSKNSSLIKQSLENLNQAISNQLNNSQISSQLNEALNNLDELNDTLTQMSTGANGNMTGNQEQQAGDGSENEKNSSSTGKHSGEGGGESQGGNGNSGNNGTQGNGNGNSSGAGNGSSSGNDSSSGGESKAGSGNRQESSDKEAKDYEKIFSPKRLDSGGEKSNIHGEMNESGQKDTIEVKEFGKDMGESVPFGDVLKSYKESEFHRLDEEEIPINMKEIVKEYFIKLDE